jgi:hypothetical protein
VIVDHREIEGTAHAPLRMGTVVEPGCQLHGF